MLIPAGWTFYPLCPCKSPPSFIPLQLGPVQFVLAAATEPEQFAVVKVLLPHVSRPEAIAEAPESCAKLQDPNAATKATKNEHPPSLPTEPPAGQLEFSLICPPPRHHIPLYP